MLQIASLIVAFWLLLFPLPSLGNELSAIQERGYIKIAVKDNIRPLGFRDAKGNLQGLEIDLAQRLAQDLLGKPSAFKLQPVKNRDRIPHILDNRVDLAIAAVTATKSRTRLVNFSIPYYLDSAVLVTKNASLQRLSDFKNRAIGVLQGSSTIARIKYFIPDAKLAAVNSYSEAQSQLETNQIEAFAGDATVIAGWVQQYPQYRLLDIKLSTEPLCVVIPKGLQHDELRRKIDIAIAQYLETGWLQQRIQYWGLPPSRIRE
jgi:polar amino acid transport system substrate-binding protein